MKQHAPGVIEWFRTDPFRPVVLERASLSVPVDRVIDFANSDRPDRFLVLGWDSPSASGRLLEIQLDDTAPPRPLSLLRTVDLGPAFFPRRAQLSTDTLHLVGSNNIAYTLAFASHPQPLGPVTPLIDFGTTPMRGGGPRFPADWVLRDLGNGGVRYEVGIQQEHVDAIPLSGGGWSFTYRDVGAELEASPPTEPEVHDSMTLTTSFPWMFRGPAGAFSLTDAAGTPLATGTFTGLPGQWQSFSPTGVTLDPGAEYRLVAANGKRSIPLTPVRRFGAPIAGSDWTASTIVPALGDNAVGSPTFGAMWQMARSQPPSGYGEVLSGGFAVAVMPPTHTSPVTFLDPQQQQALLTPQAVLPLTVELSETDPGAGIGSLLPIPDDPALAGWMIYGQMFLLTQPYPVVSDVFALRIQSAGPNLLGRSSGAGEEAYARWMKRLEKHRPFRSRWDVLQQLLRGR